MASRRLRLVSLGVLTAHLVSLASPRFYEAAAQVVTGNVGAGGAVSGAAALTQGAAALTQGAAALTQGAAASAGTSRTAVGALPGLDLRLGASVLSPVQPLASAASLASPTPLAAVFAPKASAARNAAPDAAARTPLGIASVLERPASIAALPPAQAGGLRSAAAVVDALKALGTRGDAAPAAKDATAPSSAPADPAASPEEVQASAGKMFDNSRAGTQEPGAPASAAEAAPRGLDAWAQRAVPTLLKLTKSLDLNEGKAMADGPPEPPPRPQGGKVGHAARVGLAAVMATGLGVGFVFSGAAITVASSLWSPAAAAASAVLGIASLAYAAKKRLGSGAEARHPSFVSAALAGGGLLLAGAAAAPVLASVVGLGTLHFTSIALICALALGFEFLNGMHDAANSIATVVATKTLSAKKAVLFAAFFNMAAYFVFGAHIATTIGSGLIVPTVMSNALLIAALAGASLWNWLTIKLGIPVSSSHALIGGLVGAGLVAGGVGALIPASLLKTGLFMVVSPVIGLAVAFALMAVIKFLLRPKPGATTDAVYGGGQLLSSAALCLGHGGNDSQKTMGIITALLFANGYLGAAFHVPWYVAVASYLAMGLGTLMGGWRVIKTLGEKVTTLDRPMGTAANVGAAASILLATWLGIPVSTTHVATGSVAGVGAADGGMGSVHWSTLGKIAWAWLLTIPVAAAFSALLFLAFALFL